MGLNNSKGNVLTSVTVHVSTKQYKQNHISFILDGNDVCQHIHIGLIDTLDQECIVRGVSLLNYENDTQFLYSHVVFSEKSFDTYQHLLDYVRVVRKWIAKNNVKRVIIVQPFARLEMKNSLFIYIFDNKQIIPTFPCTYGRVVK